MQAFFWASAWSAEAAPDNASSAADAAVNISLFIVHISVQGWLGT
jgi:hypothetical protein